MKRLMLGNQAIAQGAWQAGVTVATAYPGTPSTEITEFIAKYEGIKAQWSPNEKVAAEVAVGASLAGARSMVCMKHVGMNVAADPFFTAAYTGVLGGMLIVVADDPGMHSSQNEQDSRFYARSMHMPMLEPSDSQECLDFVEQALQMSEAYDTPVIVRLTTRIAHSQGLVEIGERIERALPTYQKDIDKYVMMPGMARKRHIVVEKRMDRLAKDAENMTFYHEQIKSKGIGVICSGMAYQYVEEALPEASIFKLGMVYPLPMERIRNFADKVERLIVIEELEPFIVDQVKAAGIPCEGKCLFSKQGELSVQIIQKAVLGMDLPVVTALPDLVMRPPVLCPGCPHRGVYHILQKLNLTVLGDIGCYTLGAMTPYRSLDACLCMGASIGMALGVEKARGQDFARQCVAIIGDSTFIHSGITGLIDMVYNGGTGTVLILDNSTTGMTGHQQHPGTGKTLKMEDAPAVSLERLCAACGVEHIVAVDPFDLQTLEHVIRQETARLAPSVIIARRPCALLSKVKNPIMRIEQERCKRCKACVKLGCPAIETMPDKSICIDASLCNGCGLCKRVCGFEAIEGKNEA